MKFDESCINILQDPDVVIVYGHNRKKTETINCPNARWYSRPSLFFHCSFFNWVVNAEDVCISTSMRSAHPRTKQRLAVEPKYTAVAAALKNIQDGSLSLKLSE